MSLYTGLMGMKRQINRVVGAENGYEVYMITYNIDGDTYGREETATSYKQKISAMIRFYDGTRIIVTPGGETNQSNASIRIDDTAYHEKLKAGTPWQLINIAIKDNRTGVENEYKILDDKPEGTITHILEVQKK